MPLLDTPLRFLYRQTLFDGQAIQATIKSLVNFGAATPP
jgi:hypothetical protein